jgi:hypothetical protein
VTTATMRMRELHREGRCITGCLWHAEPQDLEAAVAAVITRAAAGRFVVNTCTMCHYPCGYTMQGGRLYYDNGCDCIRGPYQGRATDHDDVRETLRMNQHLVRHILRGGDFSNVDLADLEAKAAGAFEAARAREVVG